MRLQEKVIGNAVKRADYSGHMASVEKMQYVEEPSAFITNDCIVALYRANDYGIQSLSHTYAICLLRM